MTVVTVGKMLTKVPSPVYASSKARPHKSMFSKCCKWLLRSLYRRRTKHANSDLIVFPHTCTRALFKECAAEVGQSDGLYGRAAS